MADVDLESLKSLIETERERFNVPGCAVVIVADGEVVLAEGFGLRDVEANEPVTSQTMFPIASDTKCFAAAGLTALASEGVLDLDAPVRTYIPWFEMYDPHATALVSARDLLSHRTGLPRHDFVWMGERPLTHEQSARALKHLQPNKQLRQTWQYNNLCFTTAGHLTEVLVGKPWADFIAERFFGPLGMKNSGFYKRSLAEGNFAQPYQKLDGVATKEILPLQDDDDPAGGAVSTVEDLGQWLLARLGEEVNGVRVLNDTALAQLHTPSMINAPAEGKYTELQSLGYALGTQVKNYRGHRMVHHGGNLVGFSSDIALLPGSKIGVAVLTNLHGTPLRDVLPIAIFDQLLGLEPAPWGERFHEMLVSAEKSAKEIGEHRAETSLKRPRTRPLDDFVGTFDHPAYGYLRTFVDEGTDGPKLNIDYHWLEDKIWLEHHDVDVWHLRLKEFPTIVMPLVFQTDANAAIVSVSVPMEPFVDPIVFTRRADEAAPGLLETIVASYEAGVQKIAVEQRGDDYFIGVVGQSLRLVPAGGTRLRTPDFPAVKIEAELVDGVVTKLFLDPLGVFTRVEE